MIVINIEKAKVIGHELRRIAREKEFAPFDEIISKQLPNQANDAEFERQLIREKYAEIQIAIDEAATVDGIKGALA